MTGQRPLIFKQDLRWVSALFFTGAFVVLTLWAVGVRDSEGRGFTVWGSSIFLLFAAWGFYSYRKVLLDPTTQSIKAVESDWRFWRTTETEITFSEVQEIIVGARMRGHKGYAFRRVWLETSDHPVLLSTISHGDMKEAMKCADSAALILEVPIRKTKRKFPGD